MGYEISMGLQLADSYEFMFAPRGIKYTSICICRYKC